MPDATQTPSDSLASSPAIGRGRRWARRAAWAAAVLAGLWGLGWLAVPPLVRHQAQRLASDQLGRTVTIGAVDFKPWSLELTVTDLAVATADGRADQLRVRRLYADAELQSLLRLAPVVDAIQVDEPVLRLTHLGQGRYDIDDILQRLQSPAGTPPAEPARFAFYNLALQGGALDFTDQAVGRTHQLRDLRLAVPFLSNLESQRDVHTDPHLAFTLNGSRFDTAAQTTPFARTRKTDATIRLAGLDLTPYLGYLPSSLPVRLRGGVIDADLRLAFEQNPRPAVRLSGELQASRVQVSDARGQDLLAFDRLKLGLADVQPLAQVVRLGQVELSGPSLTVARAADGRLNLALAPAATGSARSATPAPARGAGARPPASTASTPAVAATGPTRPWTVEVARVQVSDGRVRWSDATTAADGGAAAQLAVRGLSLSASGLALPLERPVPFEGRLQLEVPDGAAAPAFRAAVAPGATLHEPALGAREARTGRRAARTPAAAARPAASPAGPPVLAFSGRASTARATLTATVSDLPLGLRTLPGAGRHAPRGRVAAGRRGPGLAGRRGGRGRPPAPERRPAGAGAGGRAAAG